jgi:hypothetical protein
MSRSRGVSVASRDRGDQVRARSLLEQEAAGARAERFVHVIVEVEGGEDDDLGRARARRGDLPGRGDAVKHRHPDVHQDHVRPVPGRELDVFWAAALLAQQACCRCCPPPRWPGSRCRRSTTT